MGNDNRLQGGTAVVTGASAGIGRETVRALAANGANVVLAARRKNRLRDIAAEVEADYDIETLVVPTDVTDDEAVDNLIETSVEAFGTVDAVVANAGIGVEQGEGIEQLGTEEYKAVMNVNTDGMFYTARAALPYLKESSGVLVFVGSFAGQYPRTASPVYSATKWWTRGFALSLAGKVGDEDVGVSIVNPSEVRTEFGREFRNEDELSKKRYDPGEVTEPEEVAEAISFAARQEPPNTVAELDLYRRNKFTTF